MSARVLIGLEFHLQLKTRSKMFSPCPTGFGAPPNTLVDPVVLGLPGTLPVPNREAMLMALALATALGCELADVTRFDRKNYFYPDLPKGYQISQHEAPLARGGSLRFLSDRGPRRVRLRRLHIEEDTGKNLHGGDTSRIDYNRAGVPLVEIVTEPEIASPAAARACVNALKTLARYLAISDADMSAGNLRCEPNVNLHVPVGKRVLITPIVEIKNVNSPRLVQRAIRAEIRRQMDELKAKGADAVHAPRSTRGYDEATDTTFLMREKESEEDYRFFPEPDIPPIVIGSAWRKEASERVPELPEEKRARFELQYGLSAYDADLLCRERSTADYFEEVVTSGVPAKAAANWILTELLRHANERHVEPSELGLAPARLARLVRLVEEGRVSRKAAAREVLPRLMEGPAADPEQVVAELGLDLVEDPETIRAAARRALQRETAAATDYRQGREKAFGALMGAVMRETGGKANPQTVQDVLREILEGSP